MMSASKKVYSIFNDIPQSSYAPLNEAGYEVHILPVGHERPSGEVLKRILEEYDIVFIGTSQVITEPMLADIESVKFIATLSSGTDHIHVPADKSSLIRIVNAPLANRVSVAEHCFGLILNLAKGIVDGRYVSCEGKQKGSMQKKPVDLFGSTIGVVGAGGIACEVLSFADAFGMKRLCWTFHPERHKPLSEDGVQFVSLEELMKTSDVVVISIPHTRETRGMLNRPLLSHLKDDSIFVSTSRIEIFDARYLFEKASSCPTFGLALDVDSKDVYGMWNLSQRNVIVTPHIAGGTVQSRIRLFDECCRNLIHTAQQ